MIEAFVEASRIARFQACSTGVVIGSASVSIAWLVADGFVWGWPWARYASIGGGVLAIVISVVSLVRQTRRLRKHGLL